MGTADNILGLGDETLSTDAGSADAILGLGKVDKILELGNADKILFGESKVVKQSPISRREEIDLAAKEIDEIPKDISTFGEVVLGAAGGVASYIGGGLARTGQILFQKAPKAINNWFMLPTILKAAGEFRGLNPGLKDKVSNEVYGAMFSKYVQENYPLVSTGIDPQEVNEIGKMSENLVHDWLSFSNPKDESAQKILETVMLPIEMIVQPIKKLSKWITGGDKPNLEFVLSFAVELKTLGLAHMYGVKGAKWVKGRIGARITDMADKIKKGRPAADDAINEGMQGLVDDISKVDPEAGNAMQDVLSGPNMERIREQGRALGSKDTLIDGKDGEVTIKEGLKGEKLNKFVDEYQKKILEENARPDIGETPLVRIMNERRAESQRAINIEQQEATAKQRELQRQMDARVPGAKEAIEAQTPKGELVPQEVSGLEFGIFDQGDGRFLDGQGREVSAKSLGMEEVLGDAVERSTRHVEKVLEEEGLKDRPPLEVEASYPTNAEAKAEGWSFSKGRYKTAEAAKAKQGEGQDIVKVGDKYGLATEAPPKIQTQVGKVDVDALPDRFVGDIEFYFDESAPRATVIDKFLEEGKSPNNVLHRMAKAEGLTDKVKNKGELADLNKQIIARQLFRDGKLDPRSISTLSQWQKAEMLEGKEFPEPELGTTGGIEYLPPEGRLPGVSAPSPGMVTVKFGDLEVTMPERTTPRSGFDAAEAILGDRKVFRHQTTAEIAAERKGPDWEAYEVEEGRWTTRQKLEKLEAPKSDVLDPKLDVTEVGVEAPKDLAKMSPTELERAADLLLNERGAVDLSLLQQILDRAKDEGKSLRDLLDDSKLDKKVKEGIIRAAKKIPKEVKEQVKNQLGSPELSKTRVEDNLLKEKNRLREERSKLNKVQLDEKGEKRLGTINKRLVDIEEYRLKNKVSSGDPNEVVFQKKARKMRGVMVEYPIITRRLFEGATEQKMAKPWVPGFLKDTRAIKTGLQFLGKYYTTPWVVWDRFLKAKEEIYYPWRTAALKKFSAVKEITSQATEVIKGNTKNAQKEMVAYAMGKQPKGAEIMEFMGVEVPKELTPAQTKMYDFFRSKFDEVHKLVNEMEVKNGIPPTRYVQDYFTFMRVMSLRERLGIDFNMNEQSIKNINPKDISFMFRKTRGRVGKLPVELDPIKIFESYMNLAYRYIHMTPITAKMRTLAKMKQDPLTGRRWRLKNSNPNFNDFLVDWSFGIAGVEPPVGRLKGLTPAIKALNRNLTFGILSGYARTATIQLSALKNTYGDLGTKYTLQGIADMANPRKYRDAMKYSELLPMRNADVAIENLMDYIKSGTISAMRDSAGKLAFKPMQGMDMFATMASWHSYNRFAINELGMKGKVRGQGAARYADDGATRGQGSSLGGDISPIQRMAIGKFLTLFQTFNINDWNFLVHNIAGFKKGTKFNKTTALKVWRILLASTAVNVFFEDVIGINSPLPTPIRALIRGLQDDEGAIDIFVDVMKEFAEFFPPLSSLRYGFNPFGAGVHTTGELVKGVAEKDYIKVVESASKLGGIPATAQMKRSITGIVKGRSMKEIILGPSPEGYESGRKRKKRRSGRSKRK